MPKLIQKLSENMGKMEDFKNKLDRKSNLINHVRAACEGVLLFAWVTIPKTPMKQVQSSKESAMFYTNKVLTEFKSRYENCKIQVVVIITVNIFMIVFTYFNNRYKQCL